MSYEGRKGEQSNNFKHLTKKNKTKNRKLKIKSKDPCTFSNNVFVHVFEYRVPKQHV